MARGRLQASVGRDRCEGSPGEQLGPRAAICTFPIMLLGLHLRAQPVEDQLEPPVLLPVGPLMSPRIFPLGLLMGTILRFYNQEARKPPF